MYEGSFTSFANTNVCLGILRNKQIERTANSQYGFGPAHKICSYITGIYLEPFQFGVTGEHDEICLDFTPLGFYSFFKFRIKTYLLDDDVLLESFGEKGKAFFEKVFIEETPERRGSLIEAFLLKRFNKFENTFLASGLSCLHSSNGQVGISEVSKLLKCNEKKLYRCFHDYLDITPLDYKRIVRFRYALNNIVAKKKKLTEAAYECDYYDQSHFIKEVKFFTHFTPRQCTSHLQSIENTVLISTF